MKLWKIWYLCILMWVAIMPMSWAWSASGVSVEATVDRNEVGLGEILELHITVSYSNADQVSEPNINQIPGFEVLNSGTSTSTSSKLMQTPSGMQFETRRSTDYAYQLAPTQAGAVTIPSFQVEVDGKKYNTKPIQLKVEKNPVAKRGQPRGAVPRGLPGQDDFLDEADELFNQLLQRRGYRGGQEPDPKNLPKNPNEAFSVQLELDKREVFEGEQIVANWYIYTRGNIMSLDRLKFPDLKGFWKEIIEEVPSLNFTQEVVNGVPYRRALLASHALFPIKPGSVVVDEFKIRASVALPTGAFGTFGMGQPYTYSRSSERVKITVKPLPFEGKPNDFSGAVGQFEIQAGIPDANQFAAGQPFALKIRFEGAGNAKLIELPPLNLPPQLELYNTKNEAKFFKNGRSYKEFEILLIPRQEGDLSIPGISFSMFDPIQKKYISKKTEPIPIKVLPATGQNVAAASRVGEPTKSSDSAAQAAALPEVLVQFQNEAFLLPTSKAEFWGGLYALIFVVLGFKARVEFGLMEKQRSIRAELEKRIKKLHSLAEHGDWRGAAVEMTNTIYFTLGEVSGQGGANLEIQKLLDLAPPSIRRELGADFQKYIDIFQILSFAPESVVGKMKEKDELKNYIAQTKVLLEKSIRLAEKEPQA